VRELSELLNQVKLDGGTAEPSFESEGISE
jgi:hypothetical protein